MPEAGGGGSQLFALGDAPGILSGPAVDLTVPNGDTVLVQGEPSTGSSDVALDPKAVVLQARGDLMRRAAYGHQSTAQMSPTLEVRRSMALASWSAS